MKKKSKKIKSNKNNKDYNWNKKTIWGQLLILVGSTWLSRKEEKKERGKKNSISAKPPWLTAHSLPYRICRHSTFQMTWQPEIFGYYKMHLKKHQSINNRKLYGTKENK